MSFYRCVNKLCDENISYSQSGANETILHDREKEIPFKSRILLSCGHAICEDCLFSIVNVKHQNFYKCGDCGNITSYQQRTTEKIKNTKPKPNTIVRWNEDGADDLDYEAFSIGAAFNSGRVSITSTPVVDLDEGQSDIYNLPAHSYRDEPEVTSIQNRISNAPDPYKALIADAVNMYKLCGKSLKQLFEAKNAVNKKYVTTKEAIRKRFHILHGLLQLEEANLMKILNKSKKDNIKTLQEKEKEVDGVRNNLKVQILRAPQFSSIAAGNPVRKEIIDIRSKRLRIETVATMPDHLSSLHKPHNELRESIVRLADFSKAARFEVNIAFAPLIAPSRTQNSHAPFEPREIQRSDCPSISHIPYLRQQLVTIHDVKDSGYFNAHLPSDEAASAALKKAIIDRISSLYLHPPISSKIQPGGDYILWHDQKKEWTRVKFKRMIDLQKNSEREIFCFVPHAFTSSKKVEVTLTDYNDDLYETNFENLRESTAELSDINTYPKLLKVLKCRLKNIQSTSKNMRRCILQFCPSAFKVNLLIQSELVNDVYDVDVIHDITESSNPQSTLIEFLISQNVAKLKENQQNSNLPYRCPMLRKNFSHPFAFKIGDIHSVDVTYVKNPHHFHVNLSRDRNEIDDMETRLRDFYSNEGKNLSYRLYHPRPLHPCVARCDLFFDKKRNLKGMFHRGTVIRVKPSDPNAPVPGERYLFYAVDYGETIDVGLSDLRIIPDTFTDMRRQAFKCCLADVAPLLDAKDWSQNAIKAFQNYFQAINLVTSIAIDSIIDKMPQVTLTIHNFENDKDGIINEILIKDGFAQKRKSAQPVNAPPNPIASRPESRLVPRNNYSCYNLLREMVIKAKRYRLNTIDSLIPIKVTCFYSPQSFFIQIGTPEVQNDIKNYMKRLDEEYSGIESACSLQQSYQTFPVGEMCMFSYRPKHSHALMWRRGLVLEFVGGGGQNNLRTDPREKNQVSGDSIYRVRDKDFGTVVLIERKSMATIKPASQLRKDDAKCVEVFIPGIEPLDGTWLEQSLEHCREIFAKPHVELFIRVEDILTENQPAKLPADLIFKISEIKSGFEPSETHYYSLRFELIECNFARTISDEVQYDKEIEADDDSKYIDRKIPKKFEDDSIISSLKAAFYRESVPSEAMKFMEPEKPASPNFEAVCTYIEDGPAIWFTRIPRSSDEMHIGSINRCILQTLIQREKFEPFKGNADPGRACLVFGGDRWYRGEILNNIGSKVIVLYVDVGIKREHFIEDLSSQIFCEGVPKLAFYGKLYKCVPFSKRANAGEKLKNYLFNNLLRKNIKIHWENFGSNRDMLVSVYTGADNQNLKSILLNLDLIEETREEAEDYPQYVRTALELLYESRFSFPPYNFSPEIAYPVIIGDLIVENYLCIQLLSFDQEGDSTLKKDVNDLYNHFKREEQSMNDNVRSFAKTADFQVGFPCCAQWRKEWFRGIISEIIEPRKKYKVFFLDWGNSDDIEIQDLRILPKNLEISGPPIFGLFVRLSNLQPRGSGLWNTRLFDMMKKLVDESIDKNLVIKVKSNKLPFDVELWTADEQQQPVELFFSELINDGYLEVV